MDAPFHEPVLCSEVLDALVTIRSGVYVDATVGGGGHAGRICSRLGGAGRLICFDADEDAIRHATQHLRQSGERVTFVHANFRDLTSELHAKEIDRVRGFLFDLGVSSFQLDEGSKGFSFRSDERIDMRMDRRQTLSAWDVVNRYEEQKLAEIIWKYGEERNSRRIARKIVEARAMETTGECAAAIESAVGKRFLTKTLARVFQALRIEVNNELESLSAALKSAVDLLLPGGRIVVISYHSLEDRIVKNLFKNESAEKAPSGHKGVPDTVLTPSLRVITKNPVTASDEEIGRNPRARSAKMRVAEGR